MTAVLQGAVIDNVEKSRSHRILVKALIDMRLRQTQDMVEEGKYEQACLSLRFFGLFADTRQFRSEEVHNQITEQKVVLFESNYTRPFSEAEQSSIFGRYSPPSSIQQ